MAFNLGYGKIFLERNSASKTRNALSVIFERLKTALFLTQWKLHEFIALGNKDC